MTHIFNPPECERYPLRTAELCAGRALEALS